MKPTTSAAARMSRTDAIDLLMATPTHAQCGGRPLCGWEMEAARSAVRESAERGDAASEGLHRAAIASAMEHHRDRHLWRLLEIRAGRFDAYVVYGEGVPPVGEFDTKAERSELDVALGLRARELATEIAAASSRLFLRAVGNAGDRDAADRLRVFSLGAADRKRWERALRRSS